MESVLHDEMCFLTITYDDDHVPLALSPIDAVPLGNLRKKDLRDYFKRLRNEGLRFRYYACGEYGEQTERPHYHAILFGVSPFDEEILKEKWPYGFVQVREFTHQRAGYVASYTSKKLPHRKKQHDGRDPEFSLMSRKPGIGFEFLELIAEEFAKLGGRLDDDFIGTLFQGYFKASGKLWPLDAECKSRLIKQFMEHGLLAKRTETGFAIEGDHGYWDRYLNRDHGKELWHVLHNDQVERKHERFNAQAKQDRL